MTRLKNPRKSDKKTSLAGFIFILFLIFTSTPALSQNNRTGNVIILGYNESEKPPLINGAPDNSGAYLELYTRAIEKIGYTLQVVRHPKLRIYRMMAAGEIDFYPGMKFEENRTELVYFIPNGLPTARMGISRKDFPDIKNLSDLRGKTVILNKGGIDFTEGIKGINKKYFIDLDITQAYNLVTRGIRGDFYATDDVTVIEFIKQNKITDLKLHANFMPSEKMTLGFSKFSPYFSGQDNPNYDPAGLPSIDNQKITAAKNSVAFKLQEALREMIANGETEAIYQKYYRIK